MNNHTYQGQLKTPKQIFALTLHYQPIQNIFSIRAKDEENYVVYEAQLDIALMNAMDPSVLSTFGNIEGMYQQFVEISKQEMQRSLGDSLTMPQQMMNLEPQKGIIKVKIEIGLKSGKKLRQLVLETDKRPMSENEILELKMNKKEKAHKIIEEQLKYKINKLESSLNQEKTKNIQLTKDIKTLQEKYETQTKKIKANIEDDHKKYQQEINRLKYMLAQFQSNLSQMEFDVRLLKNNGLKIMPMILHKSKNVTQDIKNQNKKKNYIYVPKDASSYMIKGGSSWAQVLLQQSLEPTRINFFDFIIRKSKNNYICCGFGHESCSLQDDSKWGRYSITMFFLDGSIINCGKSATLEEIEMIRSNEPPKQESQHSPIQKTKHGHNKESKLTKNIQNKAIRVVLNPLTMSVQWFLERKKIGSIEYKTQFAEVLLTNKIHPLLICYDEGVEIEFI